ncbi:hypothetical protein AJ79_05147 [Helicocarpus griseus UAMH5409]|uniref:Zn(2)-C6 fungal-type domain-containing protein n=1 Tax=Helicocarpus griseus UAMH5409 TaxID=1447875 RepID=A0A2B7XPA4_9EURO|nr:hypothetical protein AJ79_05147 [Helicocarpus griseus UAMH5409]
MDGNHSLHSGQERTPPASPAAAPEPTPKNVPPPKVKGPRRRTKTGCLTCRKRRIKCGEEKPKCNNCKKSKRDCEGYAQRVVFRNPVGPMSHMGHGSLPPNYPHPGPGADPLPFLRRPIGSTTSQPDSSGVRAPFIPLAPRPNQYAVGAVYEEQRLASNLEYQAGHVHPSQQASQSPQDYYTQQYSLQSVDGTVLPPSAEQPVALNTQFASPPRHEVHPDGTFSDNISQPTISPLQGMHPQPYNTLEQTQSGSSFHVSFFASVSPTTHQPQYNNRGFQPPSFGNGVLSSIDHTTGQPAHYYYEDEIDDYYDVETDEEMEIQTTQNYTDAYETALTTTATTTDQFIHPLRSSTAFLSDDTALVSYTPSPFASPLVDPEVTRIFCHFITSVAPAMSIFERHPINPTAILSTVPVPASQQSLWTYTMPTIALRNQGLLHAILALGSHHIASIQELPPTASFRHYHYALRRVSKAVKIPGRRKQTATLAATLLLGFYEVMSAEHSKWNSHVAGASQLIQETDFSGMTKDIRSMRARAKAEHIQFAQSMPWMGIGASQIGSRFENDLFADKEAETDDALISTLMGRPVSYSNFGNVKGAGSITESERNLTSGDIEEYRIRSDLYWFYCKQDAYQSMISGNALLMPFDRWGACPPRAGVGKLDAIYGSADHLVLLLARATDFAYRDRARKVKAVKQSGGQWRPPPGFFPPGMGRGGPPGAQKGPQARGPPGPPESAGPPSQAPSSKNRGKTPPMYGMMPDPGPVRLPSGFAETSRGPRQAQPAQQEPGNDNLETQTSKAEAEWKEILAAYETFEKALGPGFEQLPPDGAPPIATPFGPAVQYRTHVVACIWSLYYTGRIILERIHPAMPPEAMMAAGICAFRTGQFANSIGRIVAGIYYPQQFDATSVNLIPSLSGVLTDMMIPLFFAGIQYTDAAQRGWTIAKLRNIARLTGGGSATAVATGCETAWTKAFEAGKGPPYQRTMNHMAHVDRGQGTISHPGGEERKFITVNRAASVMWAMGLLSLQGDYTRADERDDTDR